MRKGWHNACVAALLLALPVALTLSAFALPAQYSRVYHAALTDKAALLRDSASPRIVLIGGSGAAFDVDSSLLEREFPGCSAVNFGLYAGLGTAVMLELALPDLRQGDIVIFMPEFSGQTLSDWFDAETMWQAAEGDPALLTRLDPSRYDDMLAAFPRYAAQKAGFWLNGSAPDGEEIYARASFNGYGDLRPDLRPANRMPGEWDANTPLTLDPAVMTEEFTERVNSFTERCRRKGVQVFFRFCPMNEAALAAGERARAASAESGIRERLSCEVIGSLERALMAPGWFFDTNFHLNGDGAVMNTILLAEDLKTARGDASPVSIPAPDMPEAESIQDAQGNDADVACFRYEAKNGEASVTGLTDAGRLRASLTVPARVDGIPVLSLKAGALSGESRLETLTIQENLRSVEDGAFSGCPSLRQVILDQEDPSACTVGRGLLEGTDAVVLVPADSYSRYCTNYFWSVHATRLRPLSVNEGAAAVTQPPEVTPAPGMAVRKAMRITYHANGGTLRGQSAESLTREITYAHRRENSLQGTVWFYRDGYTLTGWNTEPDGTGIAVGLGGRFDAERCGTLYAQWSPWNEAGDFDWLVTADRAEVTGYHGAGDTCVIPEVCDGRPVRSIGQDAFTGTRLSCLILPPSLRTVSEGAFSGCDIGRLVLYDSLETVSDACFEECMVGTLIVHAAVSPVYSGSYFATFQDKLDALRELLGKRKLVLSSGSSGRYGYDSGMLAAAFPELSPVNMGVYAYTGALPQLCLILPLLDEDDVLLYAPEFDAVREQFCVSDRLDAGFWAMMEANYDALLSLDLRRFEGVFDSFGEYQRVRKRMPRGGYELSPSNYDDDGNYYPFSTYNRYGDFILPRPDGDSDARLRHNIADYTLDSFSAETVGCLNEALAPFLEKGVIVYFSYTPRNSASLTEKSTPDARAALDAFLRERLAVPVITRMEDSLMPGRYFWLIDSHLSTHGAKLRTEQLINDLKNAMNQPYKPKEMEANAEAEFQ